MDGGDQSWPLVPDPPVHRRVHDRLHAVGGVREADSCRSSRATSDQWIGGAVVYREVGVFMIGYALRRGFHHALHRTPAVPVEGAPGRRRRAAAGDGVRRRVDAVSRPVLTGIREHRRDRRARRAASCSLLALLPGARCAVPGWSGWGAALHGARSAGCAATTPGSPACRGRS